MKNKKFTIIILMIVLIIGIGGMTYAYFALDQNTNSSQLTIETEELRLILEDGTNEHGEITGMIDANHTEYTTYLSITNEGSRDVFAKLFFKGLSNNFSNDLVYSLQEVDSTRTKVMKTIKYEQPVPESSGTNQVLADGLLAPSGIVSEKNITPTTKYYKVTIKYLYSDTKNQDIDLGKTFYTGFDLEQGEELNSNIVMIDNIEDLVELANEVNRGDNKSGKEYKLMRNLDFNSDDSYLDPTTTKYGDINKNNIVEPIKTELTTSAGWNPIGNGTNQFSGTFNGQNNELQHLYINNSDTNITNVGLFGYVNEGNINNLGIKDVNITSSVSSFIGGLVGTLKKGIIDNSYSEVTSVNENIINIKATNSNSIRIGGLVGEILGTSEIKNSHNASNILDGYEIGGLVGNNHETVKIDNCYNNGVIKNTTGPSTGGIIGSNWHGEAKKTTISNTQNTGKVIVDSSTISEGPYVGGFIGYFGGEELYINDSYNEGNVTYNNNANLTTNPNIGGLLGHLGNNKTKPVILNNVHNSGNISINVKTYTASYNVLSGGLISRPDYCNLVINNSYNEGNITGSSITGGLSAHSVFGTLIINNSYNKGNLESTISNNSQFTGMGGLISNEWQSKNYIINSYNIGSLSIKNTQMSNSRLGGLVSVKDNESVMYIYNSYNAGAISNTNVYSSSTGIEGAHYTGTSTINNVFNIATITNTSSDKYGIALYVSPGTLNISNAYYNNNVSRGSNDANANNNTTSMSLTDMKASSFVTTLNNNRSNISLPTELNGYTLSTWCNSDNGPVLDYQVPTSEKSTRCPAYN